MVENGQRRGTVPQGELFIAPEVRRAESLVSPDITRQITSFLRAHERANSRREVEVRRRPEEYIAAEAYFNAYAEAHERRATEIETPEYGYVVSLATSQFNYPVYGNDCMDGRNMSAMQHGFTAGIFGSFRAAGGINPEIGRDPETQDTVLHGGQYADMLRTTIEKQPDNTVIQLFDSHVGCAARKAKQMARKGVAPADDGLFVDISEKIQESKAVKNFAGNANGIVHSLFESFDPHNGYMYIGLDTTAAREFATEKAREKAVGEGKGETSIAPAEYTSDVLIDLHESGRIISTEALAREPEVRAVLNDHYFDVDFENKYLESAKNFWENIASGRDDKPALRDTLLPVIAERLVAIDDSALNDEESRKILHDKAMLVLTNLYSGYLHNTQRIDGETGPEFVERSYPYGIHVEEGIDITEGAYGPYPGITTFEISSHEPRPAAQTVLASTIVRGNRLSSNEATRVVDKSDSIQDPEEFAAASVPVTLTEIIRDEDTAECRRLLAQIDWSAMPDNWLQEGEDARDRFDSFLAWQTGSSGIPDGLYEAVFSLRKRMIDLDERLENEMVNHDVIVMPVIQDAQRRIIGVPQLVLPGVGILASD